jgi:hypothetical protein
MTVIYKTPARIHSLTATPRLPPPPPPPTHSPLPHTQGELLLRCEELRDALWSQCDARQEAAEGERASLAGDPATVEHVGLLGQQYAQLVQVEVDRWVVWGRWVGVGGVSGWGWVGVGGWVWVCM